MGMADRSWGALRAARASVPANVVLRSFAQETVLLNVRSGQYYAVDPTGGRFLEAMAAGSDLATVAEVLAAEFDQPLERIQADLTSFVAALADRGLVDVAGGGA